MIFWLLFHVRLFCCDSVLVISISSHKVTQELTYRFLFAGGSSSSHAGSPYISSHGSIGGPFGGSSSGQGPHSSLVDFTGAGNVFGNLGSNIGGGMTDMSPGIGGLTVPDMNTISGVSAVSNSPSMLAGDESLLFPTGGTYAAPTSRSSSSSASASAPSRSNSSPSGGYTDPLTDPALVEPHVQYYFDSVTSMQYAFASERARSVLQNVCTVPETDNVNQRPEY